MAGYRDLALAVIIRAAKDLADRRVPREHRMSAWEFLREAASDRGWAAVVFSLAGLGSADAAYLLARAGTKSYPPGFEHPAGGKQNRGRGVITTCGDLTIGAAENKESFCGG